MIFMRSVYVPLINGSNCPHVEGKENALCLSGKGC